MQIWNLLHAARWKHRTQKSRQKSPSGHHRTTLSGISSQLRHISTIGKKLVKQQYVLHMSPQYGELRPTNGWDRLTSLGYPCKLQLVLRLGSVTARHLVVGVSQTLRRWTEGATYIRQGDHQVGHWPTFLVILPVNWMQCFCKHAICSVGVVDLFVESRRVFTPIAANSTPCFTLTEVTHAQQRCPNSSGLFTLHRPN